MVNIAASKEKPSFSRSLIESLPVYYRAKAAVLAAEGKIVIIDEKRQVPA